MTTTFPTLVGQSPLGPPGGSPFGPASVEFGFEIPQGSPGELEALSSGMRNASGWFGDQLMRVRASGQVALEASGGWQGSAAGSFVELTGSLAGTLSANELACEHAAGALGRLAQALSQAQQVTGQAMSDCQRLHGDLVRQQQAAIDAGSKASSLEQDASNPIMHPSAISELQHQASLARGEQGAAQLAANQTQGLLTQAQRRGQDADTRYQTEARALTSQLQAAAGDLRPVDRMAGRAAASLLGAGSGPGVAAGFPAAVIANPFTSMPIAPFAPGSILDAIEEERYRNWALRSADTLASGGAAYSSEQGYWLRRQLTDNSRRIVQLDEDIATVGPDTPDGVILSALRTAAASESSTLQGAASSFAARAGFLESGLGPALLGLGFFGNIASGENVTRAAASTGFSFAGAWIGMRATTVVCPIRTPVSEAICAGTGALAGGIGGEVFANKFAKAEDAVNRELKSDWKTLSTPIGGGGLLSGVTPLMADGWG